MDRRKCPRVARPLIKLLLNPFSAQDVCSKSKRKQITPADVYAALEAIDFPELISPLKEYLEGKSFFYFLYLNHVKNLVSSRAKNFLILAFCLFFLVQKENARAKKANISEALVDESIAEQESVHAMEEWSRYQPNLVKFPF